MLTAGATTPLAVRRRVGYRRATSKTTGEPMRHLAIAALALLAAPVASAAEYAQPTVLGEAFFSVARAKIGGTQFTDANGNAFKRRQRGSGYGARLTATVVPSFEVYGEYSAAELDIESTNSELVSDFDQVRGGFRAIARPEELAYPLYAAAGLEYARIDSEASLRFASSVSEASVGEDPNADADTRANDVPLGSGAEHFGIAHIRAGYRTERAHVYADLGYGTSDDDNVSELAAGMSFRVLPMLALLGEYRSSLFSADANNKNRYNDLRLGVSFSF
jgi:opacity protein-like surface antigen